MADPRVALLGNMNNGHFALARYLRDAGIDANLLCFPDEPAHFDPACDSYGPVPPTVRRLGWGKARRFAFTPASRVRRDLDAFDYLIGTGPAPAFAHKAGRRLDVFVPHGGDLWAMTGRKPGQPRRLLRNWPLIRAQRAGIRSCRVFHMAPTNALYESAWQAYRGESERWRDGLPNVYAPEYPSRRLAATVEGVPWAAEFEALRQSSDLLLFSSVRHDWRLPPSHPSAKGTGRLLRGLDLFRRRNPGCRARLATFEYGSDVEASKRLAASLGIADAVAWFPKMARKQLLVGLAKADLACAEFENSWIASGVLYEALALGKPILAHRDDSLYAQGPALYPILNAREPEAIAQAIESCWRDPRGAAAIGERGRDWYAKEVVARTVARYVSHIRSG